MFKIKLLEVAPNQTDFDYLKFQVSSKSQEQINLIGLSFFDDQIFKTIDHDFFVSNNSIITLKFNSPANYSDNAIDETDATNLEIFTEHAGLTKTTEQILIVYQKTPLAFFCWVSEKPSKTEIKQWETENFSELWSNLSIENCLSSENLKSNQSFVYSNNIWQLKPIETKKSNTKSSKQPTISLSNSTQPSKEILITEIFPAPNSDQTEWIEIFNPQLHTINLNNWFLDDAENGSKPYQIKNLTLPSQSTFVIDSKISKLNFNNQNDQVRLFDQNGNLIDLVEYQKAKKQNSYQLFNFYDQNSLIKSEWIWTHKITPNKSNPIIYNLSGTIISEPKFDQIYYFSIKAPDNSDQKTSSHETVIIFDENTLPATIAKSQFSINTKINLEAFKLDLANFDNPEKLPSNSIYQLHHWEIIEQKNNSNQQSFNLNIPILCSILVLTIYFLFKKFQWIK